MVAAVPGGEVVTDWGDYTPAIRGWEQVLGRPAPAPTMPNKNGNPQLAPLFVEWLMGLPRGHVTGVAGLTRAEQLKLLGNGVVPQQAAAALRHLLSPVVEPSAAERWQPGRRVPVRMRRPLPGQDDLFADLDTTDLSTLTEETAS